MQWTVAPSGSLRTRRRTLCGLAGSLASGVWARQASERQQVVVKIEANPVNKPRALASTDPSIPPIITASTPRKTEHRFTSSPPSSIKLPSTPATPIAATCILYPHYHDDYCVASSAPTSQTWRSLPTARPTSPLLAACCYLFASTARPSNHPG